MRCHAPSMRGSRCVPCGALARPCMQMLGGIGITCVQGWAGLERRQAGSPLPARGPPTHSLMSAPAWLHGCLRV